MTAAEIIEEIKRLPKPEQAKVVEFAREAGKGAALSPEELGELAKRMVEAQDPAEADRLRREIEWGFVGAVWDRQFQADVAGSRLDALADEALGDLREGGCADL